MKYEMKYSKNPTSLEEFLSFRGIKDIEHFIKPNSSFYEDPLNLDNMEEGYQLWLKHLRANDKIDLIVD